MNKLENIEKLQRMIFKRIAQTDYMHTDGNAEALEAISLAVLALDKLEKWERLDRKKSEE